jgi:hypothetical protein
VGGPLEELANGADSLLTDLAVAPDGRAVVYTAFQNWTDLAGAAALFAALVLVFGTLM